jgi:D-glycero-D-manno-heptose 1,7-bisphosphate phosphatase
MGIGGGEMKAAVPGRRAVFLDRDGVINKAIVREGKPYPPADLTELEIPPRVREALAQLKAAGFILIVVSNQPDVARGTTRRSTVEAINSALGKTLPIDEFVICCHDSGDGCHCRKPQPGMLLDSAEKWAIDLPASFMVGDRWRDVEAGQRAGCKTVFIDYGYDERQPDNVDCRVGALIEAIPFICR